MMGYQEHAFPQTYVPNMLYPTAANLTANGGTVLLPVLLNGCMHLQSVTIADIDVSGVRTWGWDLYTDLTNADNLLTRVAQSDGNQTFTASGLSGRTLAVLGGSVTLQPGAYWLAIQNRHLTATLGMTSSAASGNFTLNGYNRTKIATIPNPDKLDIYTGWTRVNTLYPARLDGRLGGDPTHITLTRDALVFAGDSITYGLFATTGNGYAALTIANKSAASPVNFGLSSETMATMASDAASKAATIVKAGGTTNNTVVIFGGTNDLAAGSTAAVTYANFLTCCRAWKAAGYKAVAVTMLPRGAAVEANRIAYNNLIRSAPAEYDALADVAVDSVIGQAGQNTNLTYYSVEAIHPNNAGHAIIANSYIIPAITWL